MTCEILVAFAVITFFHIRSGRFEHAGYCLVEDVNIKGAESQDGIHGFAGTYPGERLRFAA